jgi:hypothetical protein
LSVGLAPILGVVSYRSLEFVLSGGDVVD